MKLVQRYSHTCSIMSNVRGNGLDEKSSNPRQGCLNFTLC